MNLVYYFISFMAIDVTAEDVNWSHEKEKFLLRFTDVYDRLDAQEGDIKILKSKLDEKQEIIDTLWMRIKT